MTESERIERLLANYKARLSNWAFVCVAACILSLVASISSCSQMAAVDRHILTVAQLLERLATVVVEGRR